MTKSDIIIPAVFGLILLAIYLGFVILVPRPTLTIKIDGVSVSSLTAKDIKPTQAVKVTNGIIEPASTGNIPNAIRISLPNGDNIYTHFPAKGNKVIDVRGRLTVTTTTLDYGIYQQTNSTEMYAYTDEEVTLIENGTEIPEEVNQRIRDGN